MAKRDEAKKDNSKGRTKAEKRSGTRTAANKARAAETRARKLLRASERRASDTFQFPMNAMILATDLPKKQQAGMEFLYDGVGHPLMVPDPRRGTTLRANSRLLHEILLRREDQARKINKKAEQRRNFSRLKPAERHARREDGKRQFAATAA